MIVCKVYLFLLSVCVCICNCITASIVYVVLLWSFCQKEMIIDLLFIIHYL